MNSLTLFKHGFGLSVGWWNDNIRLAGYATACEANLRIVLDALAGFSDQEFPVTRASRATASTARICLAWMTWRARLTSTTARSGA